MHVLIADDDHVTVQLLSSVLKASGFELTIARDAMQAVMMAMRNPPDAVILDIGMPGGSGLQVLERLKKSTKTNAVPVIVVTALTDPALPRKAAALGADEFFTKPIALDRLRTALDRLLGKSPPAEPGHEGDRED